MNALIKTVLVTCLMLGSAMTTQTASANGIVIKINAGHGPHRGYHHAPAPRHIAMPRPAHKRIAYGRHAPKRIVYVRPAPPRYVRPAPKRIVYVRPAPHWGYHHTRGHRGHGHCGPRC